jgi:uncharacterized protein YjiS (DUF1127 family)
LSGDLHDLNVALTPQSDAAVVNAASGEATVTQENLATLHRPFRFERTSRPKRTIGGMLLGRALRLLAWFENWRRLRRDTDELMSLNDRELADIGLTRADIYYAVHRDPDDQ